jgi:hypothetical protein
MKSTHVRKTQFLVALQIIATISLTLSQTTAVGEEINWQVLSTGGETGSNDSYYVSGTVGQTAVDAGETSGIRVSHGFWQNFDAPFLCGDADGSEDIDIDDVVYLIAYIFSGGPPPDPYESGDADCSGAVDIDDVVYLINYIFSGGNAPCDTDGDEVPDC